MKKTAREYLKSKQYLWNLGLFAGTMDGFKEMKAVNSDLYERYIALIDKSGQEPATTIYRY